MQRSSYKQNSTRIHGNLYFSAKQPLQRIKSHCRTAPIQLQKGDSTDQNIALDTPL
jgi:hypothetical protein